MTGLTNEEVQERIAQGQVNNNENPNTRTYKQIILENTLTFFNFLNLVLLVLVLLVGRHVLVDDRVLLAKVDYFHIV